MLGLAESIKEQIRDHINEQSRLKMTAMIRKQITLYQDTLQAYVMPSPTVLLPKPTVGYKDPTEVSRPEQIQLFKNEVLAELLKLKGHVQSHSLVNQTFSQMNTDLEHPQSKAIQFLCHRKRQIFNDKSPLRMANLLIVYYLVQQINSSNSAQAVKEIIDSLLKLASYSKSELSKIYIKEVQDRLQESISGPDNFALTEASLKQEAEIEINSILQAFESCLNHYAYSIEEAYKAKILEGSSEQLKQAYAKFCQLCDLCSEIRQAKKGSQESHEDSIQLKQQKAEAALHLNKLISKLDAAKKPFWSSMLALANRAVSLKHAVCIIESAQEAESLQAILIQAIEQANRKSQSISIEPQLSAEGKLIGINLAAKTPRAETYEHVLSTPPRGYTGLASSWRTPVMTPIAGRDLTR